MQLLHGCGWSWLQECAINNHKNNNRLSSHVRQYRVQPPLTSKDVLYPRYPSDVVTLVA